MLTPAWTELRPHATQRELWRTRRRFAAVPAGRGSGKTELAKRRLVRFLSVRKPHSDPRYFYAGPVRDQAKRVAWHDLKALTPPGWIRSISESELCIRTVFGSRLWVVGMDRPARIEGVQWDGGVVDESCDQKPKAVDLSILPALTHRRGWLWRIGVPKRQGLGAAEFRRFCERARRGELEDAAEYTWPSSDILSPEDLAFARQNMDLKDYNEQFNATWEKVGGGVFYAYDEAFNVRPCNLQKDKPIVVGSDFNVDPMAWVLCHRWKNRLEVFDELWLRDANTQRSLDVLWQKYQHHRGGWEFYGDASGRARKTSAEKSDYQLILNDARFKAAGHQVNYLRGNPRVLDRFAACNALLRNADGDRRCFVDSRCEHLREDLRTRGYRAGGREPDDSGDVGHITDAWGYVAFKLFPVRVRLATTSRKVSTTRG